MPGLIKGPTRTIGLLPAFERQMGGTARERGKGQHRDRRGREAFSNFPALPSISASPA
ncbi:hypothetical protein MHPYR_180131 [uncultured Mycobacterium sp.]|uniref:Uncharacterized protein n=1 Tax=uncultured Mycobacterium sp. TaxID=171292 RepID=A0A1Y5P9E2_9MYCO|nr:hypothetical protein MHPYR_180131 [uncultured Mycobacterium sp.]